MTMLLAGDVGGTKTTLGIFARAEGPREPLVRATVRSASYPSLEALCEDFVTRSGIKVRRASFGVPGPVTNGTAQATNLPWEIDERHLAESLRLEKATLLNDLAAVAHGIPQLSAGDLHELRPGQEDPRGPIAVLAPGTGLGEAFATRSGGRLLAHGSEGGHADFAPTSELQEALLAHMRRAHGHVSYERVCSGLGIPNLYRFLRDSGEAQESPWIADALSEAGDPTPVIMQGALDSARRCGLCARTLDLFVEILGAKAGNLALTTLATGGIYLGGGIPPRILEALATGSFEEAFLSKGRLRRYLEPIPVRVILNPDAPFLGAACRGLEDLLHDEAALPG